MIFFFFYNPKIIIHTSDVLKNNRSLCTRMDKHCARSVSKILFSNQRAMRRGECFIGYTNKPYYTRKMQIYFFYNIKLYTCLSDTLLRCVFTRLYFHHTFQHFYFTRKTWFKLFHITLHKNCQFTWWFSKFVIHFELWCFIYFTVSWLEEDSITRV